MKKRIITFVLAVFLIICSLATPASAYVDTRDGVAVVFVCFEHPEQGWVGYASQGTGFFIGNSGEDPQYLVTNYHVINMYMELGSGELVNAPAEYVLMDQEYEGNVIPGRCKIYVYFDSYKSEDCVEAYPVETSEVHDLAVLKLESPTSKRRALPLLEPTQDMVGSNNMHAVGFPSNADNVLAGSVTSWGLTDVSVNGGAISKIFIQSGTGTQNLQIDININPGNSGGPLVNDDGAVVGINSWAAVTENDSNDKVNYAISVSELIPLLNRNGIQYAMANASKPITDADTDTDADSEAISSSGTVLPKPESQSQPVWPYIALALAVVVIAAVVVVLVIVNNKKKNQKSLEQITPEPIQSAPVKSPMIRSMSAQHRGLKVSVNGQVNIGRSADCALVFAGGTPGVSGRHCSISYDANNNDFILTDLRSSYGTFLENGQKLTPLVPYRLRSGDKFYLGVIDNMLIVEFE